MNYWTHKLQAYIAYIWVNDTSVYAPRIIKFLVSHCEDTCRHTTHSAKFQCNGLEALLSIDALVYVCYWPTVGRQAFYLHEFSALSSVNQHHFSCCDFSEAISGILNAEYYFHYPGMVIKNKVTEWKSNDFQLLPC